MGMEVGSKKYKLFKLRHINLGRWRRGELTYLRHFANFTVFFVNPKKPNTDLQKMWYKKLCK